MNYFCFALAEDEGGDDLGLILGIVFGVIGLVVASGLTAFLINKYKLANCYKIIIYI